jgi:hypothetical protein
MKCNVMYCTLVRVGKVMFKKSNFWQFQVSVCRVRNSHLSYRPGSSVNWPGLLLGQISEPGGERCGKPGDKVDLSVLKSLWII